MVPSTVAAVILLVTLAMHHQSALAFRDVWVPVVLAVLTLLAALTVLIVRAVALLVGHSQLASSLPRRPWSRLRPVRRPVRMCYSSDEKDEEREQLPEQLARSKFRDVTTVTLLLMTREDIEKRAKPPTSQSARPHWPQATAKFLRAGHTDLQRYFANVGGFAGLAAGVVGSTGRCPPPFASCVPCLALDRSLRCMLSSLVPEAEMLTSLLGSWR